MSLRSFLFSFEGRINRAKYWLVALASLIIAMFIMMKSLFVLADSLREADPATIATFLPILFYAIAYPLFAVGLWTYAATTIKRLHDRNRSGWWIIPFGVLPVLLPEVAGALGQSYLALFLGTVAFVLSIWSFVETFCLRGTRGPNRFGPDPLGADHSSIPAISHGLA
ncbi:Uncharacterized membrane protein YhaH, DUF805 family [Bradyrhizobium lablabi]|uniref:Uncharacterized membrane protein YhaH, DUF805 family n=1 Tax=Bradyrhizobium lablabi TaxID=722472 RepID=A0A1M6SEI0_9BRAD|nr:DUF805 domain-containing protein [Bradyrhizobium lablabi]SHK43085.1 Uncharacterized membrane protein YhaH, DUF805 family [Bradyrhizobium lablabi]